MKAALFSIATILIPLVTPTPVLNVDIHIADDAHSTSPHLQDVLNKTPDKSLAPTSEQIPGWLFISGDRVQGRIHGNTFWNIKGQLGDKFPVDEALFDPLIYSLNHPADFEGPFNGTIGRGEVSLLWEKSGATIKGRSGLGDFEVKGETKVDWSP